MIVNISNLVGDERHFKNVGFEVGAFDNKKTGIILDDIEIINYINTLNPKNGLIISIFNDFKFIGKINEEEK